MAVKTFKRNITGKSTYVCGSCGKTTRDTGHDEATCDLCWYCYEEASLENMLSDGHIDQAEFDKELDKLQKTHKRGKYAKEKKVKKTTTTKKSRSKKCAAKGCNNTTATKHAHGLCSSCVKTKRAEALANKKKNTKPAKKAKAKKSGRGQSVVLYIPNEQAKYLKRAKARAKKMGMGLNQYVLHCIGLAEQNGDE